MLDQKRLFTMANAEEAPVGAKYCFANTMEELEQKMADNVQDYSLQAYSAKNTLLKVLGKQYSSRFIGASISASVVCWQLAYLMWSKSIFVPWTLETVPLHCGDVLTHKDSIRDELITGIHKLGPDYCAVRVGESWVTLEYLFKMYTYQGKPCGIESKIVE